MSTAGRKPEAAAVIGRRPQPRDLLAAAAPRLVRSGLKSAFCRSLPFQLWSLTVVRDELAKETTVPYGTAVLVSNLILGVEHRGFEPRTPCLPGKCSPAELMPRELKV